MQRLILIQPLQDVLTRLEAQYSAREPALSQPKNKEVLGQRRSGSQTRQPLSFVPGIQVNFLILFGRRSGEEETGRTTAD
jgi:hypothetical protein